MGISAVRRKWFSAVDLTDSHATVRSYTGFRVKVEEEVIGNVLRTICDYRAETGFCRNVAAAEVIRWLNDGFCCSLLGLGDADDVEEKG